MADRQWAFILGGSGGFGWATAQKLTSDGYHLFLVHRDRKSAAREFEQACGDLAAQYKVEIVTCNANALLEDGRQQILNLLEQHVPKKGVCLLLHAIALGNVKPLWSRDGNHLTADDFAQTLHAMGYSLLEWTQLLLEGDYFAPKARVVGLSSEGAYRAGANYAAVGAAKAVLESLCVYMARELSGEGLRSVIINAGVTDTKGLRGIPGHQEILEHARTSNPLGRSTEPADVANVISLLCRPEADWINGTVIRVDGGEQIMGW